MRLKLILSFFLTISLLNYTPAQRIDTLINSYSATNPVERVYLQFDKTIYTAGETIWFKAYVLSVLVPDDDSKNLYIDFIDNANKIVAHNVYPLFGGISRGQFLLSANMPPGMIHVRAYTKWMLNFDEEFLFTKDLVLHGPVGNRSVEASNPSKTNVYFFPEGGDAIGTLKSKVAFMAEDQSGSPVTISGQIKDQSGEKICGFSSQHDGMGYFYFTPETNKRYSAFWKNESGNEQVTDLPEIKTTGITLSVNFTDRQKTFSITRTNSATPELENLHVVAIMYQQVVYLSNVSLANRTTATGSIATANLPSGIIQITVLDKNWVPLAERIAYVKNDADIFHPDLQLAKFSVEKRGYNEILITGTDSLPASLSLSVTDLDIPADTSNTIISYLLLSSQIKGKVFNPTYYFSSPSNAKDEDLDLVMLTHGWRRFEWKNVINKIPFKATFPYDSSYMSYSGEVTGVSQNQLRSAGKLLTIIKSDSTSKGNMFYLDLSQEGWFQLPQMILFDTLLMSYRFLGTVPPGNVKVQVFNNAIKAPAYRKNMDAIPNEHSLSALKNPFPQFSDKTYNYTMETLKDVTVFSRTKTPLEKMDSLYSSPFFKSDNAKLFDLRNDPVAHSSINILKYLQNKVSGLEISDQSNYNDPPAVRWRGSPSAFFVDEVLIDKKDIRYVLDLNMNDIAMVKVFPPPFIAADGNGAGGAIAIYTKRADDRAVEKQAQMIYAKITGYSSIKEFYSPDYQNVSDPKPDTRGTLFWNSNITITARQPQLRLPFYNNDFTRSFRVILEGMNSNGQLTHIEKIVR